MKPPKHRLIGAGVGAVLSMYTLDAIERYRATQTPSGWKRVSGDTLPVLPTAWRIGSSSWRVGPNTVWASHEPHKQVYVRAELSPNSKVGVSISSYEQEPLWIWLTADGSVSAVHREENISCMGKIATNPDIEAIELKVDPDGLMVTRGDNKMICTQDTDQGGLIQLSTQSGDIEIQSIGRDRVSDGSPLSPLWWMSGLMGLGFLWMLFLDLLIGLFHKLRPTNHHPDGPMEE